MADPTSNNTSVSEWWENIMVPITPNTPVQVPRTTQASKIQQPNWFIGPAIIEDESFQTALNM
eukprot:2393975-Amphidinium_carterae.2